MLGQVFRDQQRLGHLDLEATEKAIRAAMHEAGGQMLEMLVGGDTGYRGREIDCGKGHRASFVANRMKQVVTVLSPIAVERAYYQLQFLEEKLRVNRENLTLLRLLSNTEMNMSEGPAICDWMAFGVIGKSGASV